jgi:hypothetical protein
VHHATAVEILDNFFLGALRSGVLDTLVFDVPLVRAVLAAH